MTKKILVTGGAGFMGSHLADYLLEKGHEVTVLDDLSGGLKENVNSNAKFVEGTITDKKLVNDLMKDKEVVYHLAAYAAEGLSHFVRNFNYQNNLIGSLNLINAALKNNVKNFVFTSSMAVYGKGVPPFDEAHEPKPEDPYGVSKLAVEMDLKCAHGLFGMNYVIFRPHNVYGERQFLGDPYRNVLGIFMNRIMQGKAPTIYGDGEQTRAFSYVGDVTPCIAEAPFKERALNQTINIGSAKIYTVNQLAQEVMKSMNVEMEPLRLPERFEVKHAHSTTQKSEELLGFEDKTPLSEGIARMARWAKERGHMDPIVWEGYEITDKLPDFWKNLGNDFPNAVKRINAQDY